MPNILMTEEEKDRIMDEAVEAMVNDDTARAEMLLEQVPVDPDFAMDLKNALGSETMRRLNRNYAEAEAKYGPNWLND